MTHEADLENQVDTHGDLATFRRDVDKIHHHPTILKDVNFLNHIGYFCHDDHRAVTITTPLSFSDRITLDGSPFQLDYTVIPDPRYGYPGAIAFKIWDWVDSVLTFYGRPAKNPIYFDLPTLRHVCGLTKGGPSDKQIRQAINQLRYTDISTKCYRLGKDKWVNLTYRLIDSLVEFGEKNEARGGFLSISQNILTSYNNSLHLPLNKDLYLNTLKTSATRALYALFFRAFYAVRKSGTETPVITKSYQALCAQLGYKPQLYKSTVKQQLRKHMDALAHKKIGLVASWEVVVNSNKSGFNIKVTAAPNFDSVAAINKSLQSAPLTTAPQQHTTNSTNLQTIDAILYFHNKRWGLTETEGFVCQKDINNMEQFIKLLPVDTDPKQLVDFCLAEAAKQNFELQAVGGMKMFINKFLSEKIPSLRRTDLVKEKKQQARDEEEINSLQFAFLSEVWRRFEENEFDDAIPVREGFHKELMRDSVVKKAFDEGGANSVVYRNMLNNCKIQYARKKASRSMWEAFLSQQGKIKFADFFPEDQEVC